MANEYAVNRADLVAVADAIRSKAGLNNKLGFPDGFVMMIDEIKTGGGDASLGFSVVAQADQPSSPSENMIWVETSTPMPSWSLSPTAPASPEAGDVWISTGASSAVAFNAVADGVNALMVYPIDAKQYIDGVWSAMTAKSYIGGAWVDWWNGEYYLPGNMFENLTGGWKPVANSGANISFDDTGIHFTLIKTTSRQASVYTNNTINVTDYSTMLITVDLTDVQNSFSFGLATANTGSTASLSYSESTTIVTNGEVELSLDISDATGEYYLCAYSYGCEGTISKVALR